MTAGEQVALKPALTHVFAEDFHDAAGLGKIFVDGESFCHPSLAGSGNGVAEAVGGGFVGAEDAEVFLVHVGLHDGMEQLAENAGRFDILLSAAFDLDGEVAEVGDLERFEQQAAVGVGIHAHAQTALGRNLGEVGAEVALVVEQFFGLVAAHPLFKHAEMVGLLEDF